MNNELERSWKEVVVAYFEIPSWHLVGWIEENKTAGYFVLTQDLNFKSVAHIKDSIQSPVFWLPGKLGRAESTLTFDLQNLL